MELILQGSLNQLAIDLAHHYLCADFVDKVIISCWENDPLFSIRESRIEIVRSVDVENPGIGNRNRQIVSSFAGLKKVEGNYCAKLRNDQIISIESMEMMNRFYQKFKKPLLNYSDGEEPDSQVFVAGDFTFYPFHPRDHIFWGSKSTLAKVFDVPLDPNTLPIDSYDSFTRAETYIGQFYCARFDLKIQGFIDNPTEYLTDAAPKRHEAMWISSYLTPKVFRPFPRIDFNWPKHHIYGYNYPMMASQYGERWHDEPWE